MNIEQQEYYLIEAKQRIMLKKTIPKSMLVFVLISAIYWFGLPYLVDNGMSVAYGGILIALWFPLWMVSSVIIVRKTMCKISEEEVSLYAQHLKAIVEKNKEKISERYQIIDQ